MEKSELHVHDIHITLYTRSFDLFLNFRYDLVFFRRSFFFLHYESRDLSDPSAKFVQLQRIVLCTSCFLRACTLCKICKSAIHIIQYFCTHGLVYLFVNFCAITRFVDERWKILLTKDPNRGICNVKQDRTTCALAVVTKKRTKNENHSSSSRRVKLPNPANRSNRMKNR